jgi:DNA-binding cell septation regulator SpoVG
MPQQTKPAAEVNGGGKRSIQVTGWKPLVKNTLRGFLSVNLPSGMVIHNVTVHEKGEGRWVGMPSREWVNQDGAKQYSPLIEFVDRRTANKFRDLVLDALDGYLEAASEAHG